MSARLTLLCQGETAAGRRSRFPQDEPLVEPDAAQLAALRQALAGCGAVWCAPQLAARQTAAALALTAEIDPALADRGWGSWAGQSLRTVMAGQPQAFQAWLQGAPPPGGEPLERLTARCGDWLTQRVAMRDDGCAVLPAATVRALILSVLGAPVTAFALLDIHPLSITELCSDGRRWHLRQSPAHRRAPSTGRAPQ